MLKETLTQMGSFWYATGAHSRDENASALTYTHTHTHAHTFTHIHTHFPRHMTGLMLKDARGNIPEGI